MLALERMQQGDERGGPGVRCRLLDERLGHQLAHLLLMAGIVSRPCADGEDAQGPAPPGADHAARRQPLVKPCRKCLLSGLITADGLLPWCMITIPRAGRGLRHRPERGHG